MNGCRRPSRRTSVRGPRSLSGAVLCRRGALYPPAAGAAEGSPHAVHRLARLHRLEALNSLCSRPLRGSLPVLCSRRRNEPVWTRGHGGAGLRFLNWSCRRQPSHRLAAAPLSLHPKGGPRSIPIPTLYYGNGSVRVFLCGATPLATDGHGALPRAREGPWCVISSSARLHGL